MTNIKEMCFSKRLSLLFVLPLFALMVACGGDGSGSGHGAFPGGGDNGTDVGNGGTGGGNGGDNTGGGTGGGNTGGGNGGGSAPNEIGNQEELVDKLTQNPDGNFELTADIVITGPWTPIDDGTGHGFTGTLEGNGHTVIFDNVDTITPLVINGDEYVGLVGKNNGTIKDVIVEGSFEYTAIGSGNVYMGSIAGTNDGGTIIRSKSDADIKLIINASYNIIGAIGGIVGDHRNGTVEEVASLGNVTLEHSGQGAGRPNNNGYAGGIVGRIAVNGVVKNSYSAGDISNRVVSSDSNGYREIGGIAGSVYNDGALIENCFTTSNLFGSNDPVKGLVGTIVGFDGGGTWTLKNTAGLNASMTGAASKGAPYARTWSTTSNMVVMNAFHSSSLGVTTHMSGDRSVSVGSTQQDLNNFWISSLGFDASVWRWNASEKRPELAWE